ncbi:energy transducer TonB [Shewanella sp. NIFS-20-20]|uniref:energy transducer TonB n=1 Tax=Shewanella sp. NIFS-20-20 TaxID=2853806 RepID=UPI001C47E20A|nr:energy transducer TonB [Shewanella sp. NIFS-20-20]MBV7316637.1 energy transducer TonB [Shewanella sp. NIFS-20-20]
MKYGILLALLTLIGCGSQPHTPALTPVKIDAIELNRYWLMQPAPLSFSVDTEALKSNYAYVNLRLVIDPAGQVVTASIEEISDEQWTPAAMQIIEQLSYVPAPTNRKTIAVEVVTEFKLSL